MKFSNTSWLLWLTVFAIAPVAVADTWTGEAPPSPTTVGTTFEGQPVGTDAPSQLDDQHRRGRHEVRRRGEVEVQWGATNSDDNGLLRVGAGRAWFQDTEPTALGQADYDAASTASGSSTLTADETNGSGSPVQKIGHGRLWVDQDGADNTQDTDDDEQLYIWTQDPDGDGTYETSGNFLPVGGNNTNLSLVKPGAKNLVTCGSMECATTSTGDAVPPNGRWATAGTVTLSYVTTAVSEGTLLAVNLSTSVNGSRLEYEMDGLRASTVYSLTVRSRLVSGSGTCGFTTANMTTGGGTDTLITPTSSSTFATLEGTFETGTSLNASPLVRAIVNVSAGTVVCEYTNLQVIPQSAPGHNSSGTAYVQESNATLTALTDSGGTTVTWTNAETASIYIPGDGYVLEVSGGVCVGLAQPSSSLTSVFRARLHDGTTGRRVAVLGVGTGERLANTLPLEYVDTNPVPGTTYTYTLDATFESAVGSEDGGYVNPNSSGATDGDFGTVGGVGLENPLCGDSVNGDPTWLILKAIKVN